MTSPASAPSTAPSRGGAVGRVIAGLSRQERLSLSGMAGFVLLLHLIGFGLLLLVIAPGHYRVGGQVFGVGIGITAYVLGMRHAFDADHIAAIDNTTRKFMEERKRPVTIGFWFSLGHSSVVFFMTLLLATGVKALVGEVSDDSSTLKSTGGLIGTLVSGVFLVLLGVINLVILVQILKVFARMRRGSYDEATLEEHLNNRGLLNRVLRPAMKLVRRPWQMYLVGLLFGLGFDTVTEIALLASAGGAAQANLPWYAILALPVLFAAGMSLFDSIDGCFMNFAYGWAFSRPVRKVYYNITITALSVAVALVIGVIELGGLLSEKLGVSGGVLGWMASLDLNNVGYAIVALFVVTWLVALAVWRWGRIEDRWSTGLAAAEPPLSSR
ncbi:MAG: HoxN/HupN/NixA family nickel/cobalt transporter [Actinomycetes bacterium]